MNHPSHLVVPGSKLDDLKKKATAIDIREPWEREGASVEILALPNVPRSEWHTLPERFTERPLVLCCAAGVRTRMCVEMLKFPEEIYAWTGSIHEWVQ